jgi:hypothetical protein
MDELKVNQHLLSAKRQGVRNALAVSWIKKHRPDVWKEIDKEATERFPYMPGHRKNVIELTPALEEMK